MGRRCAVIDIETRSSVDAMLSGEPRPEGGFGNPALQHVASAAVLTFEESTDRPSDLRLVRLGGSTREQELIVAVDRSLPEAARGRIITFNGARWDLPILMQRAAAVWCFSVPRLAGWSAAGADGHVDMMRRGGARGSRGWPSLADRAGGMGIDMHLARGRDAVSEASMRRRCSADVAATFLLYAGWEAVVRSDARFLAGAWLGLSAMISADPILSRDLAYFVAHPVLDGSRALRADGVTIPIRNEPMRRDA